MSSPSSIDEKKIKKLQSGNIGSNVNTIASSHPSNFQAYRHSVPEVAAHFNTNVQLGLSSQQVSESRVAWGENTLGEDQGISYTTIFAHQVFNAMILVLIISMVIALAITDWISGGVIAFVVAINIGVGVVQEVKAEKTMGSLRSLSSPLARVSRVSQKIDSEISGDDGLITISAKDVVPGDIVYVSVGDTIPADIRLISGVNLETDEALLTGESLPVVKNSDEVYSDHLVPVPVGDRLNMAFASLVVSKGRGKGIVVLTGLNTEIGNIASSLRSNNGLLVKADAGVGYVKATFLTIRNIIGNVLGITVGTPLQRKLSWLAIFLFWVAVIFAIIVMGSQRFHVNKEVAIYAICVALSMIPSALIVVLTITMAVGALVMVDKHVIVRKLESLEALGGINDICSDKTGTLTQGKMIAKKVWIPSVGTLNVANSNEPLNPTLGDVQFSRYLPQYIRDTDEEIDFINSPPNPLECEPYNAWLHTAALANIATISQAPNPDRGEIEWKANGDATEIAIQIFTTRVDFAREDVESRGGFVHEAEFPFDSSIKRMSALYKDVSGTRHIYTKGAVERVLECCNRWLGSDNFAKSSDLCKLVDLSNEDKTLIEENMNALSSQGLRVLAFATRIPEPLCDFTSREQVESELIFQGLIGIYDPPREETAQSVKMCHRAGINVHMLTGDHPGTARAIAQEVGILPHNLYHYSDEVVRVMVMTASEFDILLDAEVDALPVLPLVIARCAPQTKVRMIDALHRREKFVAMTGDGVNDSPSLKKADVGIAMGLNGSDVAKDASDIVLTDDNFASILNAIEEGRRMLSNIQKFVLQLLAENVAQALYLMVGLAFIDELGYSVFPLSPVEVLWILVVTSCFPAMGLGQERAADDALEQEPNRTIFTWQVLGDMVAYGIWMAACCLLCFVTIVYAKGDGDLGYNCNSTNSLKEVCDLVFRGRSASFATMTWCALILAWECIHPVNSLFYMRQDTDNSWWRQTAIDLGTNKFLLWSIIGGFVLVFPVVYIPVINNKVFLHKGIGYEWGISFACTFLFLLGAEAWKWFRRITMRRGSRRARNPEYELERRDPFQRYASFSRSNTMEMKKNLGT